MSSDDSIPKEAISKLLQQYEDAMDDDNVAAAESSLHEILAVATSFCDQNPSREFDLQLTAHHCEENADWGGAESAYQQILSLPDLDPYTESKAHSDLAGLYRLLSRDADAMHHMALATAAARRTDISLFLAMMLQGEARCLLWCGRIDGTRAAISEALALLGDAKQYGQLRGSFLTLRAECSIRSDQIADAETDLEQAFGVLQPMAGMGMAAGVHGDLARWWSVAARLRAARGDCDGAVDAWHEAVSMSKHVASIPHVESV
jgi:tetratricopeptide (TPR) repeat protein